MKSIISKTDIRHGIGVRVCVHMYSKLDEPQVEEIMVSMQLGYIHGLTLCVEAYPTKELINNIKRIIDAVRDKFSDTKTIWVYTDEYLENMNADLRDVLSQIDVLVDGPSDVRTSQDEVSYPRFRSSHAQRVLDMKLTLARGKIVIWYDSYYANRMRDPNTHQ